MSKESHMNDFPLGAVVSVWVTALFVLSCLAAAAPIVETVLSGVGVGAATYVGFHALCPVSGTHLPAIRPRRPAREGREKSQSASLPDARPRSGIENTAVAANGATRSRPGSENHQEAG